MIAFMLFTSTTFVLTNIFAQNSSNNTEKTKNGTSGGTQGPGAALQNQTSKELSNDFGNITQSVKNLLKGNESKK